MKDMAGKVYPQTYTTGGYEVPDATRICRDECKHGALSRKCEICEMYADNVRMEKNMAALSLIIESQDLRLKRYRHAFEVALEHLESDSSPIKILLAIYRLIKQVLRA